MRRERLQYLGVVSDINQSVVSYGHDESDLTDKLTEVVKSLRDSCTIIAPEDHHSVRAMQRVISSTPPSSRGKSEAKDCQIFETFLDLASQIPSAGRVICFVTSNKADFGAVSEPKVQVDLEKVGGLLANDLSHASYIAGI